MLKMITTKLKFGSCKAKVLDSAKPKESNKDDFEK